MKCNNCNSEWNSSKSTQICPFCGKSIVNEVLLQSPAEVLRFIYDEYGIQAFKSNRMILSYFSDFAPSLKKDFRLLKSCCNTDFIGILLSCNASSKESRETAIRKSILLLTDECFLSEEYARDVVNWITYALYWENSNSFIQQSQADTRDEKLPSQNEQTESSKVDSIPNSNASKKEHADSICFDDRIEQARCYIEGRGCEKNTQKAKELLRQAADEGDIYAMIMLVELFSFGKSFDYVEIDKYGTKAETILDDQSGLINERKTLADSFNRIYVDNSPYNAEVHLQKAFDYYCQVLTYNKQDYEVLFMVGWYYFVKEYESDFLEVEAEELISLIRSEEENTLKPSLAYLLGYIYKNGYPDSTKHIFAGMFKSPVVNKSITESKKWFMIAKDKGSLKAIFELALYYNKDRKEQKKMFKLLQEAYENGAVDGARLLGLCYKSGIGVMKSRSKAMSLLIKAARQGDREASIEIEKMRS